MLDWRASPAFRGYSSILSGRHSAGVPVPRLRWYTRPRRSTAMINLNPEWTELLHSYKREHQDPRNQACHSIGIPMILASLPIGATIIGLPLAATLFTVGWGF